MERYCLENTYGEGKMIGIKLYHFSLIKYQNPNVHQAGALYFCIEKDP